MNIDNFVQSELRVIASEKLNISSDLEKEQIKNISELLIDEKEKEQKNNKQKNNKEEK
jgi:hypothetical protein